jgi:hypothetical protein
MRSDQYSRFRWIGAIMFLAFDRFGLQTTVVPGTTTGRAADHGSCSRLPCHKQIRRDQPKRHPARTWRLTMPTEAHRWVFREGWGASSLSTAIHEDGEALLHGWQESFDGEGKEEVYDLEGIGVQGDVSSCHGVGMNHGQDAAGPHRISVDGLSAPGGRHDTAVAVNGDGRKRKLHKFSKGPQHAPDQGDLVLFRGDTSFAWTTTPLSSLPPSSSSWPKIVAQPLATAAMPFDPFGQQDEESTGQKHGNSAPDKVDVLPDFMPDPLVDPAGFTIDRFMVLEGDADNKDVVFYPNRALRLYYQGGSRDRVPDCFVCPISLEVMSDPVILPDGHSFDRIALAQWLAVNNTSPATRQVVSLDDIRPNWMLRNLIRQYHRDVKERRKEQRQRSQAELLERRRQRKMPVSFEGDGRSRLAI